MAEAAAAPEPRSPPRRRRWPWVLVGALLLLAAEALLVAPPRQPTGRLLVGAIGLYQRLASPQLARAGVRCRFEPTCSRYGAQAIRNRGTLRGVGATAWRLLRCGPWTPQGTVDPPPPGRVTSAD